MLEDLKEPLEAVFAGVVVDVPAEVAILSDAPIESEVLALLVVQPLFGPK